MINAHNLNDDEILFVSTLNKFIEKNTPSKAIENHLISMKNSRNDVNVLRIIRICDDQRCRKLLVKIFCDGVEPVFKQRFIKKFWRYPSSMSLKGKYNQRIESEVIETFKSMTAEEIENGKHPNISLCSGLKSGKKKLYKWKDDGVRIIYGTVKRGRYINIIFFDSSDIKTTSDHAHTKDKSDIQKFQSIIVTIEREIFEQNKHVEDFNMIRVGANQLFESIHPQYSNFVKICEQIIDALIIEANDDLRKYDFSVAYNPEYEFEEDNVWIAAINYDAQTDFHEMLVVFNLKKLYDFLWNEGLEHDRTEITAQLKVSLWHEIAHGLILYLSESGYDVPFEYDDEDICEEYGKYKARQWTGQNGSKLAKWLKKFDKQLS